ncbi:MAG: hypothetical protein ABIY70_08875 [Capsulimonas sp.]|uniref:hypothetical protein n=1 Tax=Capsulimonas sp. TaxID=2494211 RepID=UPI0032637E27
MTDHLRLVCSDPADDEYTDEQRAKLQKAMEMVVAGYVAKQMRERRKRWNK